MTAPPAHREGAPGPRVRRSPEVVATRGRVDQVVSSPCRRSAEVSRPSVLRGRRLKLARAGVRDAPCHRRRQERLPSCPVRSWSPVRAPAWDEPSPASSRAGATGSGSSREVPRGCGPPRTKWGDGRRGGRGPCVPARSARLVGARARRRGGGPARTWEQAAGRDHPVAARSRRPWWGRARTAPAAGAAQRSGRRRARGARRRSRKGRGRRTGENPGPGASPASDRRAGPYGGRPVAASGAVTRGCRVRKRRPGTEAPSAVWQVILSSWPASLTDSELL